MTLYDIHLILPESTEFELMEQPVKDHLSSLDARWPSFPGIGTKPFDSKKLVHARMRHPALTKVSLNALFTGSGLPWVVAGIREAVKKPAVYDAQGSETQAAHYNVIEAIDKATILPYIADITEIDAGGTTTTRPVTMSDTIYLPMYAGFEPILLS